MMKLISNSFHCRALSLEEFLGVQGTWRRRHWISFIAIALILAFPIAGTAYCFSRLIFYGRAVEFECRKDEIEVIRFILTLLFVDREFSGEITCGHGHSMADSWAKEWVSKLEASSNSVTSQV